MVGLLLGGAHTRVLEPGLLDSQHLIRAEQNGRFERYTDHMSDKYHTYLPQSRYS